MYRAKSQEPGCYKVFNKLMHVQAAARLQLENDLRRAIKHQEFRVYYQPIVALDTGLMTGFEALVRWEHPNHGLLSPVDFMGVAEEARVSIFIDRWVIKAACYQVQQWRELYPNNQSLIISVNICNQHFAQVDLSEQIEQVLRETKLPAHCLQMEITENVIMGNNESATAKLERLRALGV